MQPVIELPAIFASLGGVRVTGGGGENRGAIIAIGFAKANIPVLGGTLFVGGPLVLMPINGSISATGVVVKIPIPNNSALVGKQVFFQALMDRTKTPAALTTNALEWKIGR